VNCPNCHRDTFLRKWATCTACGYRHLGKTVTETVTHKGGRGKQVYGSAAAKQRAYRERTKVR